MASSKKAKIHSTTESEKRFQDDAAFVSQIHFAVSAVCRSVENMFGELRDKAA